MQIQPGHGKFFASHVKAPLLTGSFLNAWRLLASGRPVIFPISPGAVRGPDASGNEWFPPDIAKRAPLLRSSSLPIRKEPLLHEIQRAAPAPQNEPVGGVPAIPPNRPACGDHPQTAGRQRHSRPAPASATPSAAARNVS